MSMSEAAMKSVRDMCQECSNSMTRIEGERDYIKEAITSVSEEHDLDKGLLRKMIRVYHQQNLDDVVDDTEILTEAYSQVFPPASI